MLRRSMWIFCFLIILVPAMALADAPQDEADSEIEPPPEIDEASDDVAEGPLLASNGPGVATRSESGFALSLSAGFKGGVAGSGGYEVNRTESVVDEGGRQIPENAGATPSSETFPTYSPEIYNHFGGGMNIGGVAELRIHRFLSFEAGFHYSRDNATGFIDKTRDGQRLSTIHSEQRTRALHVPVLAKFNADSDFVRPFFGLGVQMVLQQRSELNYSQEVHSEEYATDDQMDQLGHRNRIEESVYPVGLLSAGIEFRVGPRFLRFRIPIELRAGYNLAYGDDFTGSNLEDRARGEDGQLMYDGAYAGHFAIFTGVLYEFGLFE